MEPSSSSYARDHVNANYFLTALQILDDVEELAKIQRQGVQARGRFSEQEYLESDKKLSALMGKLDFFRTCEPCLPIKERNTLGVIVGKIHQPFSFSHEFLGDCVKNLTQVIQTFSSEKKLEDAEKLALENLTVLLEELHKILKSDDRENPSLIVTTIGAIYRNLEQVERAYPLDDPSLSHLMRAIEKAGTGLIERKLDTSLVQKFFERLIREPAMAIQLESEQNKRDISVLVAASDEVLRAALDFKKAQNSGETSRYEIQDDIEAFNHYLDLLEGKRFPAFSVETIADLVELVKIADYHHNGEVLKECDSALTKILKSIFINKLGEQDVEIIHLPLQTLYAFLLNSLFAPRLPEASRYMRENSLYLLELKQGQFLRLLSKNAKEAREVLEADPHQLAELKLTSTNWLQLYKTTKFLLPSTISHATITDNFLILSDRISQMGLPFACELLINLVNFLKAEDPSFNLVDFFKDTKTEHSHPLKQMLQGIPFQLKNLLYKQYGPDLEKLVTNVDLQQLKKVLDFLPSSSSLSEVIREKIKKEHQRSSSSDSGITNPFFSKNLKR